MIIEQEIALRIPARQFDFFYQKIPICFKNLGHKGEIGIERNWFSLNSKNEPDMYCFEIWAYWEIEKLEDFPDDKSVVEEIGYWFEILALWHREIKE